VGIFGGEGKSFCQMVPDLA